MPEPAPAALLPQNDQEARREEFGTSQGHRQGRGIRVGVHTGEVELVGADVAGVAVHIGARVAALAQPGQVVVSRTVRDLVAGSELVFADRGTHQLKGLSDEWQMYEASRPDPRSDG